MIDFDLMLLPDVTDAPAPTAAASTPRQRPDVRGGRILEAALLDLQSLAERDAGRLARSRNRFDLGIVHQGIPYRPAFWFPGLTTAERKAYSRAMLRLEWAGFASRVREEQRDRVTHLWPTLAGLLLRLETAPGASAELVCIGLRRTNWGAGLADYLEDAHKPAKNR